MVLIVDMNEGVQNAALRSDAELLILVVMMNDAPRDINMQCSSQLLKSREVKRLK
jgi:hypothetical protein